MGGTYILGDSLAVNEVFDLVQSSGHEVEPTEFMYWNGWFMADPGGALTQPISG